MARVIFVCTWYTQRIRIRLRGVIIQTCDTYGGHEKNPRAPLRQADVTAASWTCGAMLRALRRPLNAPLRMSTRMCGAAAGSYHPTRPTREPRRAPWPLQSSAGCRSNPPARGDPKFTPWAAWSAPAASTRQDGAVVPCGALHSAKRRPSEAATGDIAAKQHARRPAILMARTRARVLAHLSSP